MQSHCCTLRGFSLLAFIISHFFFYLRSSSLTVSFIISSLSASSLLAHCSLSSLPACHAKNFGSLAFSSSLLFVAPPFTPSASFSSSSVSVAAKPWPLRRCLQFPYSSLSKFSSAFRPSSFSAKFSLFTPFLFISCFFPTSTSFSTFFSPRPSSFAPLPYFLPSPSFFSSSLLSSSSQALSSFSAPSSSSSFIFEDTIFALSSGSSVGGRSGVAIFRLSGPLAPAILQLITSPSLVLHSLPANSSSLSSSSPNSSSLSSSSAFSSDGYFQLSDLPKCRRASLRRIFDPMSGGELLDEAIVLYFPSPNSFTGEDVVELHTHGSRVVISDILRCLSKLDSIFPHLPDILLRQLLPSSRYPVPRLSSSSTHRLQSVTTSVASTFGKIRPAEAGEFTRRAFEHGRMDLTQVEGLADLLAADTSEQRRQALKQMSGDLQALYNRWRLKLTYALGLLEGVIDFGDEDDEVLSRDEQQKALKKMRNEVATILAEMRRHLQDGRRGEIIREGFRVVLFGPPNVGKSRLFNRLMGRKAALVSPIAGTTRDIIDGHLSLNGMEVILSDTAGLRRREDGLELEEENEEKEEGVENEEGETQQLYEGEEDFPKEAEKEVKRRREQNHKGGEAKYSEKTKSVKQKKLEEIGLIEGMGIRRAQVRLASSHLGVMVIESEKEVEGLKAMSNQPFLRSLFEEAEKRDGEKEEPKEMEEDLAKNNDEFDENDLTEEIEDDDLDEDNDENNVIQQEKRHTERRFERRADDDFWARSNTMSVAMRRKPKHLRRRFPKLLIVINKLDKENKQTRQRHNEETKTFPPLSSSSLSSSILTPSPSVPVLGDKAVDLRGLLRRSLPRGMYSAVANAAGVLKISCKTGEGLESFMEQLAGQMQPTIQMGGGEKEEEGESGDMISLPLMTRQRHRRHITDAVEALEKIVSGTPDHIRWSTIFKSMKVSMLPLDIACEELRFAVRHLGKIVGAVEVDEVLDIVFKEFCVGK